ncbi:MAG: hydrolase [Hyphomonadaceae bacterium]|nr:hydrolase [Hyphomonadaceae bacterium]
MGQNKSPGLSDAEMQILKNVSDRYDDLVSQLVQWSHINSGSKNQSGLRAMRAELLETFKELPGSVSEEKLAKGSYVQPDGLISTVNYEPSVLVTVRPEADIQIVMTGHYDTVFPENSHFQQSKTIDDQTMNGPGVADMKGGILVMLEALKAFEYHTNAKRVGYKILLSPDEEIGSPGSAPILHKLGKQADIGLTYEPALADGSMAGARKGSGNFAVIINGRAAHAGREHHMGRNAIAAMARFVVKLDALNGQREGVTFNIGKIDGGGATNIVPELAIGRFNVRMVETGDQDWILNQINRLVDEANKDDGICAELTGGFSRPPKPMAPANAMVFDWVKQAGQSLGLDIKWNPSGGVCEGNNLWASGCPNVDTLGVRGGEIHSDREFIVLPSLVERTKLSALILMRIATGAFDAKQAKQLALQEIK